jgi:CBS domain-containing protein
MSRDVVTVCRRRPRWPTLATIMSEQKKHTIPVVDGGRLRGVIGRLEHHHALLK